MNMPNMGPPRAGRLTTLLVWIAGVDRETLERSPLHDWSNVRAVAMIMIATFAYQTGLLTMIGYHLSAPDGQFHPELLAGAVFIAGFILLIDSYWFRSEWHSNGLEQLKRGGLDLAGGLKEQVKAAFFLVIRIVLSVGMAQLTAVFFSLLVFSNDIEARIQGAYATANARLITEASRLVDANVQRATDAVQTESAHYAALSAQAVTLRQSQIDPSANDPASRQVQQELTQLLARQTDDEKALRQAETFASNELGGIKGASGNSGHPGNGPRHKAAVEALDNARKHAADTTAALSAAQARLDALRDKLVGSSEAIQHRADAQLPEFEKALAEQAKKLAAARDELATVTRGREKAIADAVERAPGHVARDDGLLARLRVLEQITDDDMKIKGLVILFDVVSFGFELAAVLAKITAFVPTTYASLLARDAYLGAVHIVDDMMGDLDRDPVGDLPNDSNPMPLTDGNRIGPGQDATSGSLSSIFDAGNLFTQPPQPPKRPRGRPRKTKPNSPTESAETV